ncbi:MAG: FAD-binding oxidoreductase [Candidatus Latescibacterota bacterium]|jgi:D-lactate dehydrogenase (cytochrome)
MTPLSAHVLQSLRDLLGHHLLTGTEDRARRGKDESYHKARLPQAVACPADEAQVAAVVQICVREQVPIIPFGTGTAVEGGTVAIQGGLCIDLSRLNSILRVSANDMDATVEAGVTRIQLNDYLKEHTTRLYFPVDPGADASLGGMASTRASGSAAVRYGTMLNNVLGLRAVLADGRCIHTGGRARKSAAGYDLTRLLIGAEGTLGIITELTLRLTHIPAATAAAVCPLRTIESAVEAAIAVISSGIPVARIELLDAVQMGAVNRYSQLDYEETPTLFLEFHGSDLAVSEQAEQAGQILAQHGSGPFRWAKEEEERNKLWQARHDAYHAARALRPGSVGYVTDVCVPITALASCIAQTRAIIADLPFPAPLFGHVGDGNFHVVCLIDRDDEKELEQVKDIGQQIISFALAAGGTCTGEHGIGLGKIEALERECGESIEVMRAIKKTLDPQNIMNPGKVLRI